MYLFSERPTLFDDETLTVRRYDRTYGGDVRVVDGLRVFDDAPYRTFTATGSMQPAAGKDLMQPAEGTYQTARLVWYVWIAGEDYPQEGVYVERDQLYIVAGAEQWGSYVRCDLSSDDKSDLRGG